MKVWSMALTVQLLVMFWRGAKQHPSYAGMGVKAALVQQDYRLSLTHLCYCCVSIVLHP